MYVYVVKIFEYNTHIQPKETPSNAGAFHFMCGSKVYGRVLLEFPWDDQVYLLYSICCMRATRVRSHVSHMWYSNYYRKSKLIFVNITISSPIYALFFSNFITNETENGNHHLIESTVTKTLIWFSIYFYFGKHVSNFGFSFCSINWWRLVHRISRQIEELWHLNWPKNGF